MSINTINNCNVLFIDRCEREDSLFNNVRCKGKEKSVCYSMFVKKNFFHSDFSVKVKSIIFKRLLVQHNLYSSVGVDNQCHCFHNEISNFLFSMDDLALVVSS